MGRVTATGSARINLDHGTLYRRPLSYWHTNANEQAPLPSRNISRDIDAHPRPRRHLDSVMLRQDPWTRSRPQIPEARSSSELSDNSNKLATERSRILRGKVRITN